MVFFLAKDKSFRSNDIKLDLAGYHGTIISSNLNTHYRYSKIIDET